MIDEQAAGKQHHNVEQGNAEIHPAHKYAHGFMVLFFCIQKAHIAPVELADLIVFIGKSFGGSGAGDTAFHIGVDLCYTFLNVLACGFHSHAGTHDKNQNGGQQYKHSQGNAHSMQNITAKDPASVTQEITTSSGPWWASSVTSNRSLVTRERSFPVRMLS